MAEKLTQSEIKEQIDNYNKMIESCFYPNKFTLNNDIVEITEKVKELQSVCEHQFENGYCIYCYKSEGDN